MPRPARPVERRAEIVEGAFRLLARDGIEGFSMRAVAQEAGCTIGLINHWFASKDELIDAALAQAIDDALARNEAALADGNRSIDRGLAQFLPLDETREAELRIWLAFWALAVSRPNLNARHNARAHELRKMLRQEAAALGVSKDKIDKAVDVVMPLLDGITVNALLDPDYWTPTRQLKSVRTVLAALQIEPK